MKTPDDYIPNSRWYPELKGKSLGETSRRLGHSKTFKPCINCTLPYLPHGNSKYCLDCRDLSDRAMKIRKDYLERQKSNKD